MVIPKPLNSGDDRSLVRWMLSLSERERLTLLQTQASSLAKLRHAAGGS